MNNQNFNTFLIKKAQGYVVAIATRKQALKLGSHIIRVFNKQETESACESGDDAIANEILIKKINSMGFERIDGTAFFKKKAA